MHITRNNNSRDIIPQILRIWLTLHFPFTLLMAYLAKGAEFFGGLLVATLTANLGKNLDVNGTVTVSFCLLAVILIYWGPGKYALVTVRRPLIPA
jgi:hypothetical protein